MKIYLLVVYFSFFSLAFSQRGITGDKTFSSRFPEDKFNDISNASLEIVNEVDHDIIVVIRDQRKKNISVTFILEIKKNLDLIIYLLRAYMFNLSQKNFILKIMKEQQ